MNKTGISIIIPCYNAGYYLKENIDSLLKQPFRCSFEVIVIDDGSSDAETVNVLNQIENLQNVKVIRQLQNYGVQRARNAGLMAATYDFVFTIDADDCLNTDKMVLKNGTYADRAIAILQSSPDVAFVHGMTCMFGDYTGLTISAYPATEGLILKKHHAQNSIIYRRQEGISAGFYNEKIKKWQDWSFAVGLLNYRLVSGKENRIEFLAEPYYLYRIHNNTKRISAGTVDEKEMIGITLNLYPEIFRKYYPNMADKDIIETLYINKPDKLEDLLYIAKDNIDRALALIERRGFELVAKKEIDNIP